MMMGVISEGVNGDEQGGRGFDLDAPPLFTPPPVLRPVQRSQGRGAHGDGQPAPPRSDGGGGVVGVGVVEGEVVVVSVDGVVVERGGGTPAAPATPARGTACQSA